MKHTPACTIRTYTYTYIYTRIYTYAKAKILGVVKKVQGQEELEAI